MKVVLKKVDFDETFFLMKVALMKVVFTVLFRRGGWGRCRGRGDARFVVGASMPNHVARVCQSGLRESGGGLPGPSSGHENSSHVHERSVQGCSESWSGGDLKGRVDRKRRGVHQRMENCFYCSRGCCCTAHPEEA